MDLKLGKKNYSTGAIKAKMVRKAIEVAETTNFNDLKVKDLDTLVDYITELFGEKFTRDEVYDELDADKLIPTLTDCISGVTGGMTAKLEQFPKNE